MPAALRIDNLGKRYVVSHEARRDKYRTLRESLTEMLTLPIRRMRGQGPVKYEEFWALNDISFEVQLGEVVGIIGRNGAGKSTLLKILSRITKPTRGRVELNGRVGSLLEVGTGFHPELTGRENIYLNGSILGMSKREIERKFDEIVAFAEIEQFLDTPVKRYSSGMYVRLAFAVAAHLEPEILIVDEVLAVGDTAFQKKCLGKMREVGKTGCTVLFVSHNLAAVKTLCSSGVVLGNGRVMRRDDIAGCLNTYAEMTEPHAKRGAWIRDPALPLKPLNIVALNCRLEGRQPELVLNAEISLLSTTRHSPAMLALELADSSGTVILQALPRVQGFIKQSAGEAVECSHRVSLEVALPPLIPGEYSISIWTGMHNTHTFEYLEHISWLSIADSPCMERTFPHSSDHGWICPPTKLAYTGPQTVAQHD